MSRTDNTDKLEKQTAASLLIYDKSEYEHFVDVFGASIEEHVYSSGPFRQYLSILEELNESGKFLEDESNTDILIKCVKALALDIPNVDKAQKFSIWFDDVIQYLDEASLTSDVVWHYIWNDYKKKVTQLDKSDLSFKDKVESKPDVLEFKHSSTDLLSLDDIDLGVDNKSNKSFTTGLDDLDQTVNLTGTNFMVVAARPSVGKSMFMLQQAIENARGGKIIGVDREVLTPKKTLFVSLEMTAKSIHDRIFGYLIHQDLKELPVDRYKQKVEEIQHNERYKNVMDNMKILLPESNNGNAIINDVERAIDNNGIEAIFIDYLQLVKFAGEDEWASIRKATVSLKNLAFKNNVLVVTGSQVSRGSTDTGLTLQDLYGSSTIEADTDCVIGLEPRKERRAGRPNNVNIKVLKNREGDITNRQYEFDYSCGAITPKIM